MNTKAFQNYVKRIVQEAINGNLESRRVLGALILAMVK